MPQPRVTDHLHGSGACPSPESASHPCNTSQPCTLPPHHSMSLPKCGCHVPTWLCSYTCIAYLVQHRLVQHRLLQREPQITTEMCLYDAQSDDKACCRRESSQAILATLSSTRLDRCTMAWRWPNRHHTRIPACGDAHCPDCRAACLHVDVRMFRPTCSVCVCEVVQQSLHH